MNSLKGKGEKEMFKEWDDLEFWDSGEWQTIQERLDDLDKRGTLYNPTRENIFAGLDAVPWEKVRVVIYGQDPYPNRSHATGIAFSLPKGVYPLPPTLVNIFKEYHNDLGYPFPTTGNLQNWCDQGVLLLNAYPTCYTGGGTHSTWVEWEVLNAEIITSLNPRGNVVFAFLGGKAHGLAQYVDEKRGDVLKLCHPSPRAQLSARTPFTGCKMFSTINSLLEENQQEPIDWRLP